jgi:CheY-like chemotaxis protein
MLERWGYSVIIAVDGQEAVDRFRENPGLIDGVLLDLSMPRMDGLTAFQQIRQIRPDAPVLLTSGYTAQEATQRFAGQDLTGFIQKPYDPEALRRAVEGILAAPAERRAA